MRVNKAELAQILGKSLPTIMAYLVRYSDFPVVEKGGRGKEWQFDHEDVVAFLERKREEDDQADAERAAALQQFALPLIGDNGGPPLVEPQLKPSELLALARLRRLQREEAYACRRLVVAADVRRHLEDFFQAWGRAQHAMVRQFSRENGLTSEVAGRLDAALTQCQHDVLHTQSKLQPCTGDLFDDTARHLG